MPLEGTFPSEGSFPSEAVSFLWKEPAKPLTLLPVSRCLLEGDNVGVIDGEWPNGCRNV